MDCAGAPDRTFDMDSKAPAEAQKAQPKISQRMMLRFAILLFVMAGLFFGYRWWQDYSKDPDLPLANDTIGFVAALQLHEEGSQAVVFTPDGELRASPGYENGKIDQDLVWRPDGNRLFFTSDREEKAFHVYRWNFGSDRVMRRAYGTRSQSSPSFGAADSPGANEMALITVGGFVLEYEPKTGNTFQVLPPVGKDRAQDEEGGIGGQFEQAYQRIGTSFRVAKWGKDKALVVAVMRREEQGEILVIQRLDEVVPPQAIIAGERIEFDVSPTTGEVFFSVSGFIYHDPTQIPPEAIKNGKITPPFEHLIGMFDPESKQIQPVMPSPDSVVGFRQVSVSADGSQLVCVAGKLDENANFEPTDLVVLPARAQGGAEFKRVITGKVYEPSWHPNSHTIAFVQYDATGKRGVFSINKDGSGLTDISKGKGDFAFPIFSPQTK